LVFAREKLNQREVTIEIDNLDKGGNFVGSLNVGGRTQNFGVMLVNEGFASVHKLSAERLSTYRDLLNAEEQAKGRHKNIWKNYDAAEEKRQREIRDKMYEDQRNDNSENQQEYLEVFVTEVIDGSRLYVQISADADGIDDLVATLTDLSVNEGAVFPETKAKTGDLVRAQFTEDDSWYRAKILSINSSTKLYKVLYIDYGNSELLPGTRIRPLAPTYHSPGKAKEAALAFVKASSIDSDWGREAQALLKDLTQGKKLMASVEYREEGTIYLTLGDPESGIHINASLIRAGVARLDRRRKRHLSRPIVAKLKEEEEKARAAHVGIWQYGDAPDSDEDEDEPRLKSKVPQKDAKGAEKSQPKK